MVFVRVNLKFLFFLQAIFFWKSLSVLGEIADVVEKKSNTPDEDLFTIQERMGNDRLPGASPRIQTETKERRTTLGRRGLKVRRLEQTERLKQREANEKSPPPQTVQTKGVHEPQRTRSEPKKSGSSTGTRVRRYGKRDENSGNGNSLINSGWGLISTISNSLDLSGSQEQERRRNPIEDIPVLGSLISLGGAIGLATRKGAELVVDGTKKFGDLAVGTITKTNFKYAPAPTSTLGLSNALSGVGGLSRSELSTVVTALAQSDGGTDFVKKLLDKATPESSYRIGLAAASLAGLKSNSAVGSASSVLSKLVGSRIKKS